MEFVNRVNDTDLLYGSSQENDIGRYIKYYGGTKVLINYAKGNEKVVGLIDKVKRSLRSAGIDYVVYKSTCPKADIDDVYEGINLCNIENVDFILAIGGYSEYSCSKIIATALKFRGNYLNLFKKETEIEKALPFGAICTSVAGGSVFLKQATVSHKQEDGQLVMYKLETEATKPKFVIYSPDLCTYDNQNIKLSTVRIFCFLLYRYFSNQKSHDLSDNLSLGAIRTLVAQVDKLEDDPHDIECIENILNVSFFANISFIYTQVNKATLLELAQAVECVFDCSFEKALALMTSAYLEYNIKTQQDKFMKLASQVFNVEYDFYEPVKTARQTLEKIRKFIKRLGCPINFKDINADAKDIERVLNKLGFPAIKKLDTQEQLTQTDCEVLLSLTI
ncbi:MAG: iron-containing alcohol dehydrogenase [Succinivibrio sp.]|nr:iron-containing alcohol dehydrogenase [Succinivibrio sp.]